MTPPDLSNNAALWLGLRQAESLREALIANLNGRPYGHEPIREWLASQGVTFPDGFDDRQLIWVALTLGFEKGYGIAPDVLVRGSNSPAEEWVNLGAERSGAGWQNPANFLITSAFVRLLGAWEQFELDVLKALFFYRPLGLLGHDIDQVLERVDPGVICEEPIVKGEKLSYTKPPVWTWLRKPAENNVERRKIFSNVFGIATIPEGYSNKHCSLTHVIALATNTSTSIYSLSVMLTPARPCAIALRFSYHASLCRRGCSTFGCFSPP